DTPPEPTRATVTPVDVASLDAPLADPTPPRAPPRRRSLRGFVQLGPAVQVGMLPVGPGLSAAAGLLWPRARLAFGYTRWFMAEARRAGDRPFGADLSVHAGHVRGGPLLRA